MKYEITYIGDMNIQYVQLTIHADSEQLALCIANEAINKIITSPSIVSVIEKHPHS